MALNTPLAETSTRQAVKPEARTQATKNRAIRQTQMREQLAAYGHIQHVTGIANKLETEYQSLSRDEISALKTSADIKLRLINKYLPDLKSVELTATDQPQDLATMSMSALYSMLQEQLSQTPQEQAPVATQGPEQSNP